jgi:hypothetical protein
MGETPWEPKLKSDAGKVQLTPYAVVMAALFCFLP